MGEKGARLTPAADSARERLVEVLSPLGEVTSRKMFGGYGVFESKAMFALVSSTGEVFFKVGESNRTLFESSVARRHGKMPYYLVPAEVLANHSTLRDWARASIEIAHAEKKK
jgi:DNA transformation protein